MVKKMVVRPDEARDGRAEAGVQHGRPEEGGVDGPQHLAKTAKMVKRRKRSNDENGQMLVERRPSDGPPRAVPPPRRRGGLSTPPDQVMESVK